jgi:NTP-dependent ternary conflict system VMAP-like protein/trypsin-like peptidase
VWTERYGLRDPQNDLEALFQACLVRVGPGLAFGSGVWVAPGLVLTCAHVANCGEVSFTWNEQHLRGAVLDAAPAEPAEDGGLWPYPDMSLIEVFDPPPHPCAWLDDHQVNTSTKLFAIGHADVWVPPGGLHAANGNYGGPAGGGWRFYGDEITPGMSGGPVLDVRSGTVVGLAKASRKPDTSMGGLVVPLLALRYEASPAWQRMWREHDVYHGGGLSRWPALADEHRKAAGPSRVRPTVDARELAELLGALVPAISLRTPAELVRAAGGTEPADGDLPLRGLRDIAAALSDTMPRSYGLHPLLRFVMDIARQVEEGAARPLYRWVERVAHRRDESEHYRTLMAVPMRATDDGRARAVTVKIVPTSLDPNRYQITVWREEVTGGWITDYAETASYPVDGLGAALSALVRSALRNLRGRATVEFVVPPELYGYDFASIEVGRSRLGRMKAVVLRDLERHEDSETWDAWRARWRKLQTGGAATETPHCTDGYDSDEFDLLVRGKPDVATLLLPAPPVREDEDLLGVAIYAGVPAAVWPRSDCADHAAVGGPISEPCAGQAFQDRFERERQWRDTSLPALVLELRVARDAGCRDVVLLWDDPDRIPEAGTDLMEPMPPPTRRDE